MRLGSARMRNSNLRVLQMYFDAKNTGERYHPLFGDLRTEIGVPCPPGDIFGEATGIGEAREIGEFRDIGDICPCGEGDGAVGNGAILLITANNAISQGSMNVADRNGELEIQLRGAVSSRSC